MPSNNRRFWYCDGKTKGRGHVVGEIAYSNLRQGGKTSTLRLFEQSLLTTPTDEPVLRGVVISGVGLQCTLCKNRFDWYPSLESLKKLLSHYKQDV